jgi:tetratricopeptide (TPR) repeat protein
MEAVDQFCRVMLMGSGIAGVGDARDRLQQLLASDENQVPDEAVASFEAGLRQADSDDLGRAANSFGEAWNVAPDLAEAVYNRGLMRARLGRGDQAVADLQRYLTLRPDADDAMLVSQAIGQLQALGALPRPASAMGLGFLFPGAGQFYSGRAWAGLGVLTLSAGAVAAGLLVEETTVFCVGTSTTGGECPPERVIGEETDTPYLIPGLAVAGAITVAGAIEAFFRARGRRSGEAGALVAMELEGARVVGPTLHASGSRLHVDLLRVRF